jgi:hypothetical protein
MIQNLSLGEVDLTSRNMVSLLPKLRERNVTIHQTQCFFINVANGGLAEVDGMEECTVEGG